MSCRVGKYRLAKFEKKCGRVGAVLGPCCARCRWKLGTPLRVGGSRVLRSPRSPVYVRAAPRPSGPGQRSGGGWPRRLPRPPRAAAAVGAGAGARERENDVCDNAGARPISQYADRVSSLVDLISLSRKIMRDATIPLTRRGIATTEVLERGTRAALRLAQQRIDTRRSACDPDERPSLRSRAARATSDSTHGLRARHASAL